MSHQFRFTVSTIYRLNMKLGFVKVTISGKDETVLQRVYNEDVRLNEEAPRYPLVPAVQVHLGKRSVYFLDLSIESFLVRCDHNKLRH